ncbi:uracil phosphoribosyltransferase [Cyanobium sp. FACHB-13342]|uniref:uracil phosphoribosyltransferase n=1 Tax=Cyanobium sp. FACHB-13342 TaxID=2692793 RepID=UPI001680E165|nr:uracil phosphoribosyltransferase [Cyanobium sp. FACHB-13342]MBD2423197.1 uracil phosphoribosyltransferase [Cyanobium sp. FACHB-13342]
MVMALRVVVPPHPLIGHWLGVLRDRHTPAALYATATAELGRWLSYEALRDWLPHRRVDLDTPLAPTQADLVDAAVPLVAIPLLTAGLGLWQGAQAVLPSARVIHLWDQHGEIAGLDSPIDPRAGVLLFCAELGDGDRLIRVLDRLAEQGVSGDRLRVVTALASAPGLQSLGERHGHLTLYTAAIDPDLNALGQIVPGIGPVTERLFAGTVLESVAGPA